MKQYTDQFNRMLTIAKTDDFVILDTETTGLGLDYVVQIAVVKPDGSTLLDMLVNPGVEIPKEASKIHGIYDRHVQGAATWDVVVQVLSRLLPGRNVFIYNADYDLKIMRNHCLKNGIARGFMEQASFYCAMQMYAEFYGDWNDYHQSYRWQRLGDAAQRFGSGFEPAHDARNDCLMARAVLHGMVEALKPIEAPEDDLPF